ncbi:hypothetical protein HDU67_002470 [Dinochytrium kinnereticum]|nr:hypothetical protein HDU67_002470 [Dinochytrium kinnereticum]
MDANRTFKEQDAARNQRAKYLSSQYLFESTLTQSLDLQANVIDLQHSVEIAAVDSQPRRNYIFLDPNDPYRGHSSLPILNDLLPKLVNPTENGEMPLWMKNLLVKAERRGGSFGTGINYLVEELSLLLIEWTDEIKSSLEDGDRDSILSIMRYFVENAIAEQKFEIRKNIRLFRGLVELFAEKAIAPTDSLFRLLAFREKTANGSAKSSVITERYIPCAECVGSIMKVSERDPETFKLLEDGLHSKSDRSNLKPFVVVINKISLSFPRILKSNYKRLLYIFPRLDVDLKAKCLESLLSWSDEIDDLFPELMNLNLEALLRHRDVECQTFTLRILATISERLKSGEVSMFISTAIETFLHHPSERCRAAFFSLIYQLDKAGKFSGLDKMMDQLVKRAFLVGLNDPDAGIRQSMSEYVNSTMFGSKSLLDRVVEILRDWYIPQMEDEFLACSLELILAASENSPSYSENMYSSLSGMIFNDKNIIIDNTWSNNRSMQPLFAATLAQDSGVHANSEGIDVEGGVRATQDMIWTPTQDLSPSLARQIYTLSTPEFDRMPSISKARETRSGGTAPKLLRPLRFSKSQEDDSRFYYADEADRRKKRQRKMIEQQKQARERKVTLFRKYREGELPDIEIKYKDVILPLRALIGRDTDIAMTLFASLFTEIHSRAGEKEVWHDKKIAFEDGVKSLLNQSSTYVPSFIGSMLKICHDISDVRCKIDTQVIARVADGSANYHLGVLVIEKTLMSAPTVISSKRVKTSTRSLKDDAIGWIELAKLYKGLDLNEIYRGIYETHASSSYVTKDEKYNRITDGIAAELIGDFEKAKNMYLEGLRGEDIEANKSEPELWAISRLRCFQKLGEWEILTDSIYADFDGDLTQIWTDEKSELYLAYLFKGLLIRAASNPKDRTYEVIWRDELNLKTFYPMASATGARLDLLGKLQPTRFPSFKLDLIEVWDETLTARKWMMQKLFKGAVSNMKRVKEEHLTVQYLATAKAARKQHLFSVAERWLAAIERSSGSFHPDFSYEYCKLILQKFAQEHDIKLKVELIDNALRHLSFFKHDILALDEMTKGRFQILQLGVRERLVHFVSGSDSERVVAAMRSHRTVFTSEIDGYLGLDAIIKHLSATSLAESWGEHDLGIDLGDKEALKTRQKYYYKFSSFLDRILRAFESNSISEKSFNADQVVQGVITGVLRSMRSGSLKATDLFPRLLQIIELYDTSIDAFSQESANIPTWMFLKWLPQMTALMDKKSWEKVYSILKKVAEVYPDALRFPFNISCEQYNIDRIDQKNKIAIDSLRGILDSPMVSTLIRELRRLQDPIHLFKDCCERIEALIASQEVHKRSKIRFETEEEKRFPDILKTLAGYKAKIGGEGESKAGVNDLKSFSFWLEAYHSANFKGSETVEIPGQYDGEIKPDIRCHAKILRFSPSVLVMSSMRRPKRLKMVGDDEKSYPWLVKGGEDLRLDQRIQQMFAIMNKLMGMNSFCVRSRISLITYKVIPMSNSLGIIEWVDGTKPLKACMAEGEGFDSAFKGAQKVYSEFIKGYGKSNQPIVSCFDPYLQTAKRADVLKTMETLYARTHRSYLTEFLQKLSSSPEAYFEMRLNFSNSLAALNICSYLLGIGDRHLDNFLVDLKCGQIIGIDFGHAFGSATEVLPVPELVPFRLTKQMERLMEPLGVAVMLKRPMTHVLSAIQEGKANLLNALDIFAKEPLIEWRKFAANLAKRQGRPSLPAFAKNDFSQPSMRTLKNQLTNPPPTLSQNGTHRKNLQ